VPGSHSIEVLAEDDSQQRAFLQPFQRQPALRASTIRSATWITFTPQETLGPTLAIFAIRSIGIKQVGVLAGHSGLSFEAKNFG
jgi:hypothetical protein